MPIKHKTITKIAAAGTMEAIENAFAEIDQQVNEFLSSQHWSQSRDSFQTITPVKDSVVITRTLVYTDEQLATTPSGPPVGVMPSPQR